MPLEQPAAPRAQVQRTPGGITVSVPARRHIFVLVFLCFWLIGWALGAVSAGRSLVLGTPDEHSLFLMVWLAGWLVGGSWALAVALWQLGGRETLTIEQGRVVLQYRAFALARRREFDRTHVLNWRTVLQAAGFFQQQGQFYPFGFGQVGSLAFDYGSKTVYCAAGLEEAEARQVLERLRNEGFVPQLRGAA